MLQFVQFQKSYGNFPALTIDNLTISSGIYWIKGVNGSGKSTLLRAVAGILSFNGDIILDRKVSIKKNPVAYRQLVNFAEAEPLYPSFLTGTEMINLFANAKKAPVNQQQYFIESMQMQTYIDTPLGTYSSGMLKKLSLVLAFIGNPKLVLLDEPLITLDSQALKVLYQWIVDKNTQEGISFLLSSHQELNTETLLFAQEILVEKQTLKFNQ
jgi:ABC-2 type transport system ATP-binding protein